MIEVALNNVADKACSFPESELYHGCLPGNVPRLSKQTFIGPPLISPFWIKRFQEEIQRFDFTNISSSLSIDCINQHFHKKSERTGNNNIQTSLLYSTILSFPSTNIRYAPWIHIKVSNKLHSSSWYLHYYQISTKSVTNCNNITAKQLHEKHTLLLNFYK